MRYRGAVRRVQLQLRAGIAIPVRGGQDLRGLRVASGSAIVRCGSIDRGDRKFEGRSEDRTERETLMLVHSSVPFIF